MWYTRIDRTILSLLTILITGAGLFAVLTKFDVPQTRLSFFGENPYALKRDIIDGIMVWIFTSLALFGLIIQTCNIIFGHHLSERIHSTTVYIKFFLIGLVSVAVLLVCLGAIGKYIAKKIWWPQIVQKQIEGFKLAEEIIINKGYYNKDLENFDRYPLEQQQQIQTNRYKQSDKLLSGIEDLLEIKGTPNIREERYNNLKKYFKNIS